MTPNPPNPEPAENALLRYCLERMPQTVAQDRFADRLEKLSAAQMRLYQERLREQDAPAVPADASTDGG